MIAPFVKLPKNNSYKFRPRYYDPIKEEMEERHRLARVDAKIESDLPPGSIIKGQMKRNIRQDYVKKTKRQSNFRLFVILIFLFALAYFLLISDSFFSIFFK